MWDLTLFIGGEPRKLTATTEYAHLIQRGRGKRPVEAPATTTRDLSARPA